MTKYVTVKADNMREFQDKLNGMRSLYDVVDVRTEVDPRTNKVTAIVEVCESGNRMNLNEGKK